jgi:hypothetical protein
MKLALLCIITISEVTDKVINEKGEPISGVTVTIKGTNNVTLTHENGEFFNSFPGGLCL